MTRLIDADRFIKENAEIIDCEINHPKYQDTIRELIDKAPTITIPVAKLDTTNDFAEWVFDSKFTEFGNPYGTYKCSSCGGHSSNKYFFCMWCGADMRKEGEKNEQTTD